MVTRFLVAFAIAPLALASVAMADLTPMEELGKNLFFDNIASPDRQSCASCHAPSVGFTGPIPGVNRHGAVYAGAVPQRFGNRKPPSAAYATLSPLFHYDETEELFVGGNFWDGRATGWNLGNPAADQALGPFLNPVEQNNASKADVLAQVAGETYSELWEIVFGEPLEFDTPEEVETNYDRIGLAIGAYEASSEVNQFSSKFDFYMAGEAELTPEEQWGMDLFNGEALCSACHPAPLFTDFTYDNLGTPRNQQNPWYDMDRVLLPNGEPINPEGGDWVDVGLGGFLETLPEEFFTELGLDKDATVAENLGKQKVPTLRNVGKRPGLGFPKAYMHNGAFKSLKEVVHFYNTRDVEAWPPPEVPVNVNEDELGDLGLTDAEEDAIVAFMNTLSDGWVPTDGRRDAAPIAGLGDAPVLQILSRNPHPTVQLGYQVAEAGLVRLDVFNVAGRRVATLADGWQEPGAHQVEWSGADLANGLYVVRLATGSTTQSRKITLIR